MTFCEIINSHIKDEKLRAKANELCNVDISTIYPDLPSFTINDLMERQIRLFTEKAIKEFLKENPQ